MSLLIGSQPFGHLLVEAFFLIQPPEADVVWSGGTNNTTTGRPATWLHYWCLQLGEIIFLLNIKNRMFMLILQPSLHILRCHPRHLVGHYLLDILVGLITPPLPQWPIPSHTDPDSHGWQNQELVTNPP